MKKITLSLVVVSVVALLSVASFASEITVDASGNLSISVAPVAIPNYRSTPIYLDATPEDQARLDTYVMQAADRAVSMSVAAATGLSAITEKINVNTATEKDLTLLPGVGGAYAKNIIAARPYATIEELTKAKGIGDSRLELLRPLITVE